MAVDPVPKGDDSDRKDTAGTHKKMSFLTVCPPRMWPLRQLRRVWALSGGEGWCWVSMLPRQQVTHQFCMKPGGPPPLPLLLERAGVLERVSYLAVSRVGCDRTADDHHHSDVACVGVRGWGG